MWEKVQTGLLVTFVAVLLWLYAEAENVETVTFEHTARLVSASGTDMLIDRRPELEGGGILRGEPNLPFKVTIVTRSNSLQSLELEGIGVIDIPVDIVPEAGRRRDIELLPLFQNHEELRRLGITIESVQPQTLVDVRVEPYREAALPLELRMPEGATINQTVPATVRVRLPASAVEGGETVRVIAEPRDNELARLEPGVVGDVALKWTLANLTDPNDMQFATLLDTDAMRVKVTLQRTQVQATLQVPVYIVAPPSALAQYIVKPERNLVQVKIAGPKQTVTELQELRLPIRAELLLKVDTLAQSVGKQVTAPLVINKPATVTIVEPPDVMTFTVERVPTAVEPEGVLP